MKNMINREGFTETINSCQNDNDEDESLANYEPLSLPTSGKMDHMDIKEQAKNQNAQQPTQPAQQQQQQSPQTQSSTVNSGD